MQNYVISENWSGRKSMDIFKALSSSGLREEKYPCSDQNIIVIDVEQ